MKSQDGLNFQIGWPEKASLERWPFSKDLKLVKDLSVVISGGRISQAGGQANAKAL